MNYHRYSCRVCHDTNMRIRSSVFRHQHHLAGKARTSSKDHITRFQFYLSR